VSTELSEPEDADTAHTALEEFRANEDECNDFFGGVFDQLQSLSLELFARHKCLELNNGRSATSDASLIACREDFQRASEQIQHLSTTVEKQLARLTAMTKELAEARRDTTPETHITAILETMRWQQADWLQQRAALESEVESLRSHAAEQAEALHEQKRQAARQQAELGGELKRMRSLVEALSAQFRGDPLVPSDGKRSSPVDSFTLSSVLAQFQMLQRDSAARNTKRNGEVGPAGLIPEGPST
jgi:chromosome segregation ATPase